MMFLAELICAGFKDPTWVFKRAVLLPCVLAKNLQKSRIGCLTGIQPTGIVRISRRGVAQPG